MPIPVGNFLTSAGRNILHAVVSGAAKPTPTAKLAAKLIPGIDKMPFGADQVVQMAWDGGSAFTREMAEGLHNIHGPSSAAELQNLEIQMELNRVQEEQQREAELAEEAYVEAEIEQMEMDLQEIEQQEIEQLEQEVQEIEAQEQEAQEAEVEAQEQQEQEIEQQEMDIEYDYSYSQ